MLAYHHVYPDGAPELKAAHEDKAAGAIGEGEFRRQMRHIAEEGWRVVATSEIVNWLLAGADLLDRALALHFDNGWLDTRTVAMPILKELGMTAMCYVVTGGLDAASGGQSTPLRTQTEGRIEKPFMTWQQAGELLACGWEIGAHTATHPRLAETHAAEGDAGVIREIETSHAVFRERLGFVPPHFAYPSGSRSRGTDELLAPYYRSLRRWHIEFPIVWSFADRGTSPLALDCQNMDFRVPFQDFKRIFSEALAP